MDVQVVGGVILNLFNGVLGVFFILKVILQYVDFVQYGELVGLVVGVFGVNVVFLDGQVIGGYVGVGVQYKDYCVGLWQYVDGQFWFGVQGVQVGCVQYVQVMFE